MERRSSCFCFVNYCFQLIKEREKIYLDNSPVVKRGHSATPGRGAIVQRVNRHEPHDSEIYKTYLLHSKISPLVASQVMLWLRELRLPWVFSTLEGLSLELADT